MILLPVLLATRVAVLPVGPDPAAAGSLAQAVEDRLSAISVTVVPSAEIAAALAPPARLATSQKLPGDAEGARLLEEATQAYYDGRAAVAVDRLTVLNTLQERELETPIAQRVRTHLWRAAAFLLLKDPDAADTEAVAALTIDPQLKVDLTEFGPTVAELVERDRPKIAEAVLTVTGFPAGARVTLDDRPIGEIGRVPKGRHILRASAAGYREVVRAVDVNVATSMAVPLAISLPAEVEASLSQLAWGGPSPANLAAAARVVERLHLDWLVIAASHGLPADGLRTVVISGHDSRRVASAQSLPGAAGESTVAAWSETALRGLLVPATHSVTSSETISNLTTRAGLGWSGQFWSIRGSGSPVYRTGYSGAGGFAAVGAAEAGFDGEAGLSWTDFALTTVEVTLPDGSRHGVTGGSALGLFLDAGRRFGILENALVLRPSLAILFDERDRSDIDQATGAPAHLFPSTTWLAPELRVGATVPFRFGANSAEANARLGIEPFAYTAESPSGSSGHSPLAAPGYSWQLGARMEMASRFTLGLTYSGLTRSAKYSGTASAAYTPAVSNATVDETTHSVILEARYRF